MKTCEMRRGQAEIVTIWFRPVAQSDRLTTTAQLIFDGEEHDLDIGESANACRSLSTGACPAAEGSNVIQRVRIPISPVLPLGSSAVLRIRTRNDHEQQICFQTQINIV